jgi:hypothetical protein
MDVDPPSDESSDIEGDLEAADTPTSSQGAIGEGHSNSDEMDASDNEVVVTDGKYTPRKMHIADDSDMQVIGSLHPTRSSNRAFSVFHPVYMGQMMMAFAQW